MTVALVTAYASSLQVWHMEELTVRDGQVQVELEVRRKETEEQVSKVKEEIAAEKTWGVNASAFSRGPSSMRINHASCMFNKLYHSKSSH